MRDVQKPIEGLLNSSQTIYYEVLIFFSETKQRFSHNTTYR